MSFPFYNQFALKQYTICSWCGFQAAKFIVYAEYMPKELLCPLTRTNGLAWTSDGYYYVVCVENVLKLHLIRLNEPFINVQAFMVCVNTRMAYQVCYWTNSVEILCERYLEGCSCGKFSYILTILGIQFLLEQDKQL